MTTTIVFSDAPLGHEVRGLRLDDPADAPKLHDALTAHGVVYVRGQSITPADHVALTRRMGEIAVFSTKNYSHPAHPEIFVVSNIVENGRPIGMADAGEDWHSDGCYTETPPWASIMHALEVPQQAGASLGNTCFASMAAAFDALPAALQTRIDGLQAVNSYASRARQAAARMSSGDALGGDSKNIDELLTERSEALKQWPDVVHPLVRRHPFSGRRSLYVSPTHTIRILGLPDDEAADLLDQLMAHVAQPAFIYRHAWQPGDVLLWDNAQTTHKAIFDYKLPQRRLMHRTTIQGSRPV
jgi:taurine dioxygenase